MMQNLNKILPFLVIAYIFYAFLHYVAFTSSLICISAAFAYISNPIVRYLRNKFSLSLELAAFLAIFFNIIILGIFIKILIPIIYAELLELSKKFPDYIVYLKEKLHFLSSKINNYDIGIILKNLNEYLLNSIQQILHSSINIASEIWSYTLFTIQITIAIFVIPILTYCITINWKQITTTLESLISKDWLLYLKPIVNEIDESLSAYIKGQTTLIFWMSMAYILGLWLINVEFYFLLGIMSGMSLLLPLVGAIFSIAVTLLVSIIQFGFTIKLVYISALFLLGHTIETYYLAPKILGSHLGVNPIIVLLAILTAAELNNTLLIFLAMPLLGVAKILLKYLIKYYKKTYNIK